MINITTKRRTRNHLKERSSYRSGFSPEDISSNAAGAEFGDDYLGKSSTVSEDLGNWFKDAGARDSSDPAASKSSLPLKDPAVRGGANRGSSNVSNTNGPGAKACPATASSCS